MQHLVPSLTIGVESVRPPIPDLREYVTILEPERDAPDWWAGAPSVCMDDDGCVWLISRLREAESPRGERGYALWIGKSSDGIHFEHVKTIHRDEVGTVSFERPSLLRDPITGKFKLYYCRAGKPEPYGWYVGKFEDVDEPSQFDPKTAHPVLRFEHRDWGVKDPYVINIGGLYHMFVIGYGINGHKRELPYLALSIDGERWEFRSTPLLPSHGWHNFFTRPACLLPMGSTWVLYYEGSNAEWFDPPYNLAGGIAVSMDAGRTFIDLTPHQPMFETATPGRYRTARYTDYLALSDRVLFYYEAFRPNDSAEVRMTAVWLHQYPKGE